MCDSDIVLDLNQEKIKCPSCGTEFNTKNLALYGNCLFEENLYDPYFQDTIVPKSYFEKMKVLEREKKDEEIYDLAHEIVEKYPSEASANFLAAIALGNLLNRRKITRPKDYDEIAVRDGEPIILTDNDVLDYFDKSLIIMCDNDRIDNNSDDKYKNSLNRFFFWKEVAFIDNAINDMTEYLKSKNKEHFKFGDAGVAYTKAELKNLQTIDDNKKAKVEIQKGTRKKKHFFSKNIFVSLGLIACILIIICAVIHPFVPVARYLISGTFYDWVGVAIAVLVLLARIGYVVEHNGDVVVNEKETFKSVEEKDTINIRSLIKTAQKIRDVYGEQYFEKCISHFVYEPIKDEEEFLIDAYSEFIIAFKMLKTDLVNNVRKLEDVEIYRFWDLYDDLVYYNKCEHGQYEN